MRDFQAINSQSIVVVAAVGVVAVVAVVVVVVVSTLSLLSQRQASFQKAFSSFNYDSFVLIPEAWAQLLIVSCVVNLNLYANPLGNSEP